MRKKLLLAAGALLLVGIAAAVIVIGPNNIVGMMRYDTREEGKLKVGDRAPDVEMVALGGERVHLAARFGGRPTVLIFGSFT